MSDSNWKLQRGEDGMAEATYLPDPRYQVMEYAGGGFAVMLNGEEQQVRATFGRAMEEVECEATPSSWTEDEGLHLRQNLAEAKQRRERYVWVDRDDRRQMFPIDVAEIVLARLVQEGILPPDTENRAPAIQIAPDRPTEVSILPMSWEHLPTKPPEDFALYDKQSRTLLIRRGDSWASAIELDREQYALYDLSPMPGMEFNWRTFDWKVEEGEDGRLRGIRPPNPTGG